MTSLWLKTSVPMMPKTTTKKSKSASSAKRGNAKTTGNEPFNVNTPPPKKNKDAANRASKYFSTTNKKGYTVNPWSRGSRYQPRARSPTSPSTKEDWLSGSSGNSPRSFSRPRKQPRSQSPWILHGTMGIVIPRTR